MSGRWLWSGVIVGLAAGASTLALRATPGRAPAPQTAATAAGVEELPDGIRLQVAGGFLTVELKTDAIARVLFSKDAAPRVDRMVVVGPGDTGAEETLDPFKTGQPAPVAPPPSWSLKTTATTATLTTSKLNVHVTLATGAVSFADAADRPILAEAGGHQITPTTVQDEATYHVQQMWKATPGEALYGLGQRQEGKLNLKGYDFDLWQRNTVVEIPFLVSSRGYGLLWDNTSFTKFGDTRPFEPIPAADLDRHERPARRAQSRRTG